MKRLWAFDGRVASDLRFRPMLSRPEHSILAAGFVWPCLPVSARITPSGKGWLHEIKHDGFRVIARKTGNRVRLYSRSGNDLTYRFPLIVDATARLPVRACIIGKAPDYMEAEPAARKARSCTVSIVPR